MSIRRASRDEDEILEGGSPPLESDQFSDSNGEDLDLSSLIGGSKASRVENEPVGTCKKDLSEVDSVGTLPDDPILIVSGDGEPSEVGGGSLGEPRSLETRTSSEGVLAVEKKDGDKENKPEQAAEKSGRKWKRLGRPGKKLAVSGETQAEGSSPEGAKTSSSPEVKESKGARKITGRKTKLPSLKQKAKPAREEASTRPAAFSGGIGGSIGFVCSECYEEFLLPASYSQETVCCPECLHVGKRPDADFLRTVNRHKAGERRALALAIASGVFVVGLVLYLLWLTSDMYVVAHGKPEKNFVMGLLGGSAILTAIFVWLSVKSESNLWEVYF